MLANKKDGEEDTKPSNSTIKSLANKKDKVVLKVLKSISKILNKK